MHIYISVTEKNSIYIVLDNVTEVELYNEKITFFYVNATKRSITYKNAQDAKIAFDNIYNRML